MAKGIFSQLARRGMGLDEGQVQPPMAFTLMMDLLLREMLLAGVVKVVAKQCIAALAFMGDLWSHNGSRESFIKAFSVMKSWARRFRHDWEISKVAAMCVNANGKSMAGTMVRSLWQADSHLPEGGRQAPPLPYPDDDYLSGRRPLPRAGQYASAYEIVTIVLGASVKLLDVCIHQPLSMAPHVAAMRGMAAWLLRDLRVTLRRCGDGVLCRHVFTSWVVYARMAIEWSAASWGWVPKGTMRALESLQRQALVLSHQSRRSV